MRRPPLAVPALLLLLAPALALAAPPRPPPPPGDAAQRAEQVKRLRVLRAVGLAEALDLDEAGALKLREALVRHDAKRAPLQHQLDDAVRALRAAAAGEAGAGGQVDGAAQRLTEARQKLAQLDGELLAEVAQGATPARKARAALFLAQIARRPGPGPAAASVAAGGPAAPGAPPRPPYAPPPRYPQPPPGAYAPQGVPPPVGPPEELEPPGAPYGAPPPGAPGAVPDGPGAEDWFSDSP